MSRPNAKFVADLTDAWTFEDRMDVAVVLGLFSRRVVGWPMNARMTGELVAVESVFSSLKTERVCRKVDRIRDAACAEVFGCSERFHNPHRRHSTLGYESPIAFEAKMRVA